MSSLNRELAELFERIARLNLNEDEHGPLLDPLPTVKQLRSLARLSLRLAEEEEGA